MPKYDKFVMFSAGPVGDHLVQIDMANHFFETTGLQTVLIMKHPSKFLSDFVQPYHDHISEINFGGVLGLLRVVLLSLTSIWQKNCYILVFPIVLPSYMKFFVRFIRYCTRSRVVGFNLEGSKNFPVGRGYASILGERNTIPMLPETFAVSSKRMLEFLGYAPREHVPNLDFVSDEDIFNKLGLEKQSYIAMHLTPSHILRTLPVDRWNQILRTLFSKLPETKFVFTGSAGDIPFIDVAIEGCPKERCILAAGKTNARELMTLYKNAVVDVTVQTGNALLINMLHAPAVVVNIKGTSMFYYDFNENATILYSSKDCVCDPFETSCNLVTYQGHDYMACVFNIPNEDVVSAVVNKFTH
jgi:hypothetical protein